MLHTGLPWRDAPVHPLVEVLLQPKVWSQNERDGALAEAMSAGRLDLVDLLLAAGAAS